MTVFKHVTKQELENPAVRWIDARFSLQDPGAGAEQYRYSHVEGAVHWDLEKDLSDMGKKGGRHPLPDRGRLTELFRSSGLQLDDPIIVYDSGGEPFAARAWWILKYAGFRNAAISLEGFDALQAAGARVTDSRPETVRSDVVPEWDGSLLASKEQAAELSERREEGLLLDARAAARYRGEHEPLDRVAGHIPGAKNFDWSQLVNAGMIDPDGPAAKRLGEAAELRQPVTVYCGSGVTAAPLFAMLKEKGLEHVRLYAGSYSDWIEDGDREVAAGGDSRRDFL